MPKVKEVLVYQFDELSKSAKDAARQWWREGLGHDEWWDQTYDDAKTIATLIGIEIGTRSQNWVNTTTGKSGTRQEDCIFFSGFSSQGDGASYTGTYRFKADALEAVKEHAPQDAKLHAIVADLMDAQKAAGNFIGFKITTSGHYSHSYSMDFELLDLDVEGESDVGAISDDAEKTAREALRRFADWIYRQLESEYEYLTSDEQVDESIKANEYEFLENGERA